VCTPNTVGGARSKILPSPHSFTQIDVHSIVFHVKLHSLQAGPLPFSQGNKITPPSNSRSLRGREGIDCEEILYSRLGVTNGRRGVFSKSGKDYTNENQFVGNREDIVQCTVQRPLPTSIRNIPQVPRQIAWDYNLRVSIFGPYQHFNQPNSFILISHLEVGGV